MSDILSLAAAAAAGISVGCLSWLLIETLRKIEVDPTKHNAEEAKFVLRLPILFKLLLPLVPNVMFLLKSPFFQRTLDESGRMLEMAGYDQTLSREQFAALKILTLLTGLLLAGLAIAGEQVIGGLLVAGLSALYPTVWLKTTVARRHKSIMKALPNLLDLLTLSIEAGRDFLSALRDILARRDKDPLGEEFTRALQEIQLGKKRQAALREMARRVNQPELLTVVNTIVQADEMGVSIGGLLKIQSDQLRAKRFNLAEKLAAEAPVKILFPVILFIFPAVFLVLLGPILMQAMKTMR